MARRLSWIIPFDTAAILVWLPVFLFGSSLVACTPHSTVPPAKNTRLSEVRPPIDKAGPLREEVDGRSSPLRLDEAIEEALRASPELRQIEERVGAAAEQVRQAEAAFYPWLVLSEEFNVTDNPVYALMNIINQRRLEPTVDFSDPGRQQNLASQIRGGLLFAIIGGEYILRLLPRGTHTYSKLIRPSEMKAWNREAGLEFVRLASLMYNPFTRGWKVAPGKEDVNYMAHFHKK